MKRGYKNLRDCVFHNPLGLSLLSPKMQKIASDYLPVSVGIEVECAPFTMITDLPSTVSSKLDIMSFSSSGFEQRFRLYPGIRGMIGLYNVSEYLKRNFGINNESGIHYHIDCTERWENVDSLFGITDKDRYFKEWALCQLDQWKYLGGYNPRKVTSYKEGWISRRLNFKTLEIRIGEMTFDYNLLMRRITHSCYIVNKILNT